MGAGPSTGAGPPRAVAGPAFCPDRRARQAVQSSTTGWPTANLRIRSASDDCSEPLWSVSQRASVHGDDSSTAARSAASASVDVIPPSSFASPHTAASSVVVDDDIDVVVVLVVVLVVTGAMRLTAAICEPM